MLITLENVILNAKVINFIVSYLSLKSSHVNSKQKKNKKIRGRSDKMYVFASCERYTESRQNI